MSYVRFSIERIPSSIIIYTYGSVK